MARRISQRTIVQTIRALNAITTQDWTLLLYENDFPGYFVMHGQDEYRWFWKRILIEMKAGIFFFHHGYGSPVGINGDRDLSRDDAQALGEVFLQRLAALATTLQTGEPVLRSLQLDGFEVDRQNLRLIPLEGPVSATQESDRLTQLVDGSGLPNRATIVKHVNDAISQYTDGQYHSSLNESRSFVQAIVDGISTETDKNGKPSVKLPGPMKNRMEYLEQVGFLIADEKTALGSAWGSLSTGSHPGVPEREQARIGLVLALEFGQLLLIKLATWKVNGYQKF